MQRGGATARRHTWASVLWPLSAIAIPLASLVLTRAAVPVWVLVTEAALLAIAAPLAGVAIARHMITLWSIARSATACVSAMGVASVVMTLLLNTPLNAGEIFAAHAMLCAEAFALIALGTLCASACRDVLDAAAWAAGVACAAAAVVFAAGPILADAPTWFVQGTLFVNPIVTTAASANIDIFRTELLYQISPLAHIQFTYPTTMTAFTGYMATAGVFFSTTAYQISRRMTDLSGERTSA